MDEAVRLLLDILSIPSVNSQDDEGKVAEYLCEYFKKAGIPAVTERIDKTHANVYAVLEGEDNRESILWNGHLDTVPYGDLEKWNTDPAVPAILENKVYARGCSDMKSGLCAMVYALCASKKAGKKVPHTIYFTGTCDEEKNGTGAIYAQQHNVVNNQNHPGFQKWPDEYDKILIGEPTGLKLGIGQKGCIWLELKCKGKTSHAAYPEQGCSAVSHLLNVAEHIKQFVESHTHPVLGSASANITKINGGIAPNMIPDQCTLLMDIRITPDMSKGELLEKAGQILDLEEAGTEHKVQIEYEVKNERRAIEISEQASLMREMVKCLKEEGLKPETIGINFFTDASILAKETPDTQILLFGPGEPSVAHQPNEWVDLEKYKKSIDVYKRMIDESLK